MQAGAGYLKSCRILAAVTLLLATPLLGGCAPSLFRNESRVVKNRARYFPDSETLQHEHRAQAQAQGIGMGAPTGPAGY